MRNSLLLTAAILSVLGPPDARAQGRTFSTEVGECIDRCLQDERFCRRKLDLHGNVQAGLCGPSCTNRVPQARADACVAACSRNAN